MATTTPDIVPLIWTTNKGRNGFDSPIAVGQDSSVESRNIVLYQSSMGRKRGGSTLVPTTGVTLPFVAMTEFVPGQDLSASELHGTDSAVTTKMFRCTTGTFTSMTLADAVTDHPERVSYARLNGKLYIAYHSGVNRLHVYDPGNPTTNAIRAAGIGTPLSPVAADGGGAGTYAAIVRYYRVAFTEQRSGVTIRRSLLGGTRTFTPDGAHLNVTITKPTALGEGETHWEIYASPDNVLWYALAADIPGAFTTAINISILTTYADSTAVSSYATFAAAPPEGQNTPFPSVQCLATDGKRLLGFGVPDATASAGYSLPPKNGRLYFTDVLDTTTINDDERISNIAGVRQNWLDIARNNNCVDRGISPTPVNNCFYAFQSSGVYQLIPTESATTPYRRVMLDGQIGNIGQQCICIGRDKFGQSFVFFCDPVLGPYIVGGLYGLRWCGKDVKDIWDGVNKDARSVAAFAFWNPFRTSIYVGVSYGATDTPTLIMVLDVTKMTLDESGDLRGGWTTWDGNLATAQSGVMFSSNFNANRSLNRVPYFGAATKLLRYDETQTQDDGVPYQGSVTSGARVVSTDSLQLQRAYVAASAQANVSLQQSLIRNFGDETTRVSTVDLSPVGSENAVLRKFGDAALQDAWAVQVQLGDATAVNSTFALHQYRAQLQIGNPL